MAVRREAVRLVLEDSGFSTGMAKNAAATALLGRQLDSLSGSAVRTRRDLPAASKSVDTVGTSSRRAGPEIDRLSGRLRLLADTAAVIGPALVPIGAVAIPAIAGLAAQFGAAAVAGGTAIIAFQGVGDALEAVNEAQLEPSAANLEKARIAMQNLAPEARSFVREIQAMRPAFDQLQAAAAGGLFPGMERALFRLNDSLPNVERVLFRVADAAGDVAEEFAAGIAGPRGQRFLRFVQREVPIALADMGEAVGNLVGGLAELWQAFTPLNRDFSGWLVDATQAFDDWARGLRRTEGFQDFVDYIRTNGPLVADALGSIGNALVQIVTAAAPLGGPVLRALTAVADVIAEIAGSDAGPAIMATVTAMALMNRSMSSFARVAESSWGKAMSGSRGAIAQFSAVRGAAARAAGGIGLLATSMTDLDDKAGLSNTAMGALAGTMAAPGWGTAIGASVGFVLDLASAQETAVASAEELRDTLNDQTGAITKNTEAMVANALETEGILRAASDLGLNLHDVTQAALGNEDAFRRVNGELDRFVESSIGDNARQLADKDMQELNKAATDVREAIGGQNAEVDKAVSSHRRLTDATRGTAGGFNRARSAAEEFRATVERVNRILEGRANLRDFEESLDNLTASIKENGRSLDITTKKGRANQAALDEIASTALRVAENMRGTNRVNFLNQARRDFVDAAQKLGMGEAAAKQLADRLGLVHRQKVKPSIDVDTSSAAAKMQAIERELTSLDGRRATTYVETVYTSSGKRFKDVPASGSADGGTVPKTGLHYADRHPYLLADGEEVISNRHGQADRHRELLKAINANRLADGGTVGRSLVASGPATSVSVAAPSVAVGGAQVRVFIDGREVRAIVDEQIDSADGFRRTLEGVR